jgi:hypothetical protein
MTLEGIHRGPLPQFALRTIASEHLVCGQLHKIDKYFIAIQIQRSIKAAVKSKLGLLCHMSVLLSASLACLTLQSMSYTGQWGHPLGASTSTSSNLSLFPGADDAFGCPVERLEFHELMKNHIFQELHQQWTVATNTMVLRFARGYTEE